MAKYVSGCSKHTFFIYFTMKNLLFALCSVLIFSACNSNSSSQEKQNLGINNTYLKDSANTENTKIQLAANAALMAAQRNLNVSEDSAKVVEFYFYSDADAKVATLAKALEAKGYLVEFGNSAAVPGEFVCTGRSTPLKMSALIIDEWVKEMCSLGFEKDCRFDGWVVVEE
jgi:hypothetical protein